MPSFKRIFASPVFQGAVATAGACYLRLVGGSTRHIIEPADVYDTVQLPIIIGLWHGQHFIAPFIKRKGDDFRAKVLISRHRDGEINARVAEKLGIGTIRGSGAHNNEFNRKGGVSAFAEMLDALKDGYTIALTADIPKVARVAGLGIVKLAQRSGRPIYAAAMATQHRVELNSWDRAAVNLPFGRLALVASKPIFVAGDADEAALETARQEVENSLNAATARAYAIVDGKGSGRP
jgi:lysophospholipid acyltransferase (LPLAT)-like uncharacterized protein